MMIDPHPDKVSFKQVWNEVIRDEIRDYKSEYPDCIELIPDAEEEVWNAYVEINSFVKNNYMKDHTGILDRHKVAACYMAAIATAKPMRFVMKIDGERVPMAINECLAITTALSVLRSYAITAAKEDNELSEEQRKDIADKFENGIFLPDEGMVEHGSYIDNYANELAFAVKHGKLFVLSLAHELYLLELMTRNRSI